MRAQFPIIFLFATFGAWAFFGFPSPDTLLRLLGAKEECTQFAKANRDKLFPSEGDAAITPVSQWMKNGKIVVEIAAIKAGSPSYRYRLCVLGDGHVEIISIFEHAAWR